MRRLFEYTFFDFEQVVLIVVQNEGFDSVLAVRSSFSQGWLKLVELSEDVPCVIGTMADCINEMSPVCE